MNKDLLIMSFFVLGTILSIIPINGQINEHIDGQTDVQLDSQIKCDNKCIGDVLYKGVFDIKTKSCKYIKLEECLYGCENGKCIDAPDDALMRKKIYDMNKKIYNIVKTKIEIRGTEYYGGEYGKVFLQLTDNGRPINNASCFVTIYYPNTTKFINDVGMISVGEDGLYYINFFVPEDIYGVYMVSAYCYLPTLAYTINCTTSSYDGFENGWSGGYGWSDTWYHEGDSAIVSVASPYNGTYHLRLRRNNAWVERPVNNLFDVVNATISFWAKAYSFEAGEEAYFYFWDGNWHLLKRWVNGEDDNIYHYYEFNITPYHLGNNIIAFESGMSGAYDFLYIDDIKINSCYKTYYFVNDTIYQEVRGSGELHVSELPEKIYDYFISMPEPEKISNHDVCLDNYTLIKELTYKLCINNRCKTYSKNVTIPCDYGCVNNKCRPEPFFNYLIIGVIVFFIMAFIIIVRRIV